MKYSDIKLPSNRKFGFFFSAIFSLGGLYFFLKESAITSYLFLIIALIFFIVTILKSDLLLPLNKLWMSFGFILGMIINPIVLGIIFFLIFTPISLLMHLFRRDELRLKIIKRSSHWKERKEFNARVDSFKQQF